MSLLNNMLIDLGKEMLVVHFLIHYNYTTSKYQNIFFKVSHLLECVLLGCFLFFLR